MKTSKKLILALFSLIILIVLSTVIIARIYAEKAKKQKLLPVVTKTKNQTILEKRVDSFDKIFTNVTGSITLVQSDTAKIIIKTVKRSTLFNIQYEVQNGTMVIMRMDTTTKPIPIEVILHSGRVNSIRTKMKADIFMKNIIIDTLTCRMSGGTMQGIVQAKKLELWGGDSARYSLSGRAEKLILKGQRNSEFNLTGFEAGIAWIEGNSGSRFQIFARDTLFFDLSNDCRLDYTGDPVFYNLNMEQQQRFRRLDQP